MKNQFSTFDIVKALSIPRNRLKNWVGGYIIPTQKAAGQGTKAVFTLEDVYKVGLFDNLIELGFNRERAGLFLKDISKRKTPLTDTNLLLIAEMKIKGGHASYTVSTKKQSPEGVNALFKAFYKEGFILKETGNIHIINFSKIRKEIDTRLTEL